MAKLDDRSGLVLLSSARPSATGQPRQPTIPSIWLMRRSDQRQLEGGCRRSDLFEERTVLARHHRLRSAQNPRSSVGQMALLGCGFEGALPVGM